MIQMGKTKFEFFLVYLELIDQSECMIKMLMTEIREFITQGVITLPT
jgi:hypothetical protein